MQHFSTKLIKFILLFAGSICLALALVALSTNWTLQYEYRFFGHRTHWGSSMERIAEFEHWAVQQTTQPKGLILGSSTAYRNLNAEQLSIQTSSNWFNYGSSNQSPKMSLFLLQDAFSQTKLDFVLLDIYSPIVKQEGLEAAFDLIYNSELGWWQKTQLLWHYPNVKLWLRYAYFYTKKALPCPTYIVLDPSNGTYHKKGFVCANQTALHSYQKQKKATHLSFTKSIAAIAALCRAHGTRLILNIAPSLDGPTIVGPAYHKYAYLQHADINFPTWFYDSHHMTCNGATRYTERVAKKLNKLKP